jgi:hypothetical protein
LLLSEAKMTATEFRRLKAFEHLVRDAIETAARDCPDELALAATTLATQVEKFQALSLAAQRYAEMARESISEDVGNLYERAALLANTRDLVGVYFASNAAKRQYAIGDTHHISSNLVDDYDALLAALASLHNSFNALAWNIGERSAEADVVAPGTFGNADDLFAAIGV